MLSPCVLSVRRSHASTEMKTRLHYRSLSFSEEQLEDVDSGATAAALTVEG